MDVPALESWIAEWVAQKLGIPLSEVNLHVPMAEFGMNSMVALELSGQLESLLAREVSPTVAMDHPTIAEVAVHLLPQAVSKKQF
jgi:polyketide synthase 13